MKKIGALGALLAVGLLAGCIGSGEGSAGPSATVTVTASPSPERVLEDGEALRELANINTACEREHEDKPSVFKYFATCGDNIIVEFGPEVDLDEHPKIVTDAYLHANDLAPWLISDEWMIKGTEKQLLEIQASYPTAKFFSQTTDDPVSNAISDEATAAVEKVYGVKCEEFHRNRLFFGKEVKAQRQFDCDGTDPIKVFSSVPAVKGTHIYVFETDGDVIGFGEAASTDHEFDGKDRYGVEGGMVMIAPLPKAEAKEISKLVDGSKVVDISLNPFTDR